MLCVGGFCLRPTRNKSQNGFELRWDWSGALHPGHHLTMVTIFTYLSLRWFVGLHLVSNLTWLAFSVGPDPCFVHLALIRPLTNSCYYFCCDPWPSGGKLSFSSPCQTEEMNFKDEMRKCSLYVTINCCRNISNMMQEKFTLWFNSLKLWLCLFKKLLLFKKLHLQKIITT